MAADFHLYKRDDSDNWYMRMRVPKEYLSTVGSTHKSKSLGTADKREAKKIALKVADELTREWIAKKARRDLTGNDLASAAVEHYHRELERDLHARMNRPTADDIASAQRQVIADIHRQQVNTKDILALHDASVEFLVYRDQAKNDKRNREGRYEMLLEHLASGETALIAYAADEFIDRHKLTITPGTDAYKELCHRLARGEIEFLKRTFERDRGDFTGTATDPLLTTAPAASLDMTTFAEIIDRREKESKKGIGRRIAPTTLRKYRTQTKQFTEWRQSDRAATVTEDEVIRWRDELMTTDSAKTVKDKLGTIRAVLMWGYEDSKRKLFPAGFPIHAIKSPRGEIADPNGKAYSIAQAQKVLRAARKQTGAKRWVPWLAAYTGARPNELFQLEKRDLEKVGDYYFLFIRVEGEQRTNKAMIPHYVPLHAALVEEGFVAFVEAAPSGPLFSEARAYQNTIDWIRDTVMQREKGPLPGPLYGFRHLWQDLRFDKIDLEAANYIIGHTNKGAQEKYGKSKARLPALGEIMNRFPNIMKLDRNTE